MAAKKTQEAPFTIFVGRMGFGTSRSLESARRRARRMAQEEAGTYGTVQWRVVDADGRTVANGIENA